MKLWRNIRIVILIIALLLSIVAINPRPWQTGATIRNVASDSAAATAELLPSGPDVSPVLKERIISIDGMPVKTAEDYLNIESTLLPNTSVRVQTNRQTYVLVTEPILEYTILPELETVSVTAEVFNNETQSFENVTRNVTQNKTISKVVGTAPLGLTVYDAPKTNIRFGLDISGGARVLLQPEGQVTQEQMDTMLDTIKKRLNVYGLSDIVVRSVSDLSGNQFILVEVAGASEQDVRELILRQGKFEAKIGNETVMRGSDVTYVCRSPQCSGIGQSGCGPVSNGYACQFQFQITLTPEAGARQGEVTKNLAVIASPTGSSYLEKPLDLYLDDQLTDTLQISSSLKGAAVTSISITGSGAGSTESAAVQDALANMKQLQTILQTGSLPVKLNVVKTDSVSAELGEEFIRNALFVGLLAFLAVTVLMVVRFRNPRVSIPVIITLVSELLIILGVAALFKQNLDLAAIAGILVAIGTGVDDQIVIADETLGAKRRRENDAGNWKDKLKKAFFIIFAAYFTAMASLVPLLFAGAGLVRGFAIASMVGITAGVLITRPAFAIIMEKLERED